MTHLLKLCILIFIKSLNSLMKVLIWLIIFILIFIKSLKFINEGLDLANN